MCSLRKDFFVCVRSALNVKRSEAGSGGPVCWDGSLLPVEMLIPLLDATAASITHGINILLTSLIFDLRL